MYEAIVETLFVNRGILGLDKVIKALKKRNPPTYEVQIHLSLQGSPQYKVLMDQVVWCQQMHGQKVKVAEGPWNQGWV